MKRLLLLVPILVSGCSNVGTPPTPPRPPVVPMVAHQALLSVPPAAPQPIVQWTVTLQQSQDLTNWADVMSFSSTNLPSPTFFRTKLTSALPPINVTTWHNDNQRTGANLSEWSLTPGNVNTNSFGKLWSYGLDGQCYTQPLVWEGRVFVATEHNTVYCFDANGAGPIWTTNLGMPAYQNFHGDIGIDDSYGITGTPVIDPARGVLYVDAYLGSDPHITNLWHAIHALDCNNGSWRASPVTVTAPGFDPRQQMQRPALVLANGLLYVAYGSFADAAPYSGWVFAFDPLTLSNTAVFRTSAAGEAAAVWQGGGAPAVDPIGNLYLETGNGIFDGVTNFGDSFLKLSPDLHLLSFFAPSNQLALENGDNDLGSSGPIFISDANRVVGTGKEGLVYVLDPDALGGYSTNTNSIVAQWREAATSWGVWGNGCYANGTLFYHASYDYLRAFKVNGTPLAVATNSYNAYPGASVSLSANGTANAIVWEVETDDYYMPDGNTINTNSIATLHAYDAMTLRELYNSDQRGTNDAAGTPVKFGVPTIANGKVYIGQRALVAYGLKK